MKNGLAIKKGILVFLLKISIGLGFLGVACGVSNDRMQDKVGPNDVVVMGTDEDDIDYPDEYWFDFMYANDDRDLTDCQRQEKLCLLFTKIGYKVSFKDTEKEA